MAPLHTGQASRLLGGGAGEEESCALKRPLPLVRCAASGGPLRFLNWSDWARSLRLPFQPWDSRIFLLLSLDTCLTATYPSNFLAITLPTVQPHGWLRWPHSFHVTPLPWPSQLDQSPEHS